eukprot:TRINITY_DN6313_c1_g1_i1.p1 TRINITY_DN6313_c1_g1~~TRINITY_DN6313_c1_g1_i1.p1  ORF type:complete len:101 (-),score=3.52 TRINITY_DN6313_c1_g1_i1:166-468(-)
MAVSTIVTNTTRGCSSGGCIPVGEGLCLSHAEEPMTKNTGRGSGGTLQGLVGRVQVRRGAVPSLICKPACSAAQDTPSVPMRKGHRDACNAVREEATGQP